MEMDIKTLIDNSARIGLMQLTKEITEFSEYLLSQKPKNILEIGICRGGTFYIWANIATGIKLGIDLPNGNFSLGNVKNSIEMAAIKSNLEKISQNCHIFFGDSKSINTINWVKKQLNDELLDFLFIDGDHTYSGVKQDYDTYSPLVRSKGIIAFHDINETKEHHHNSCHVYKFWQEIIGDKHEITVNDFWGGIGFLIKE